MTEQEAINRETAADIAGIRAEVGSLRELKEDVSTLKQDVNEGNHAIRNALQTIVLDLARLRASNEGQQKTAEERGKSLRSIENMMHGGEDTSGFFERLRKLEEKEAKRFKFIWSVGMSVTFLIMKQIWEFVTVHK
jgi:chromosome segregation ATPase